MKRKKAKRVRARVKKAAVATPTLIGGALLFKVLSATGASCHGGSMQWSLPDGEKPGQWHEIDGPTVMCRKGFHLTDDPKKWWVDGARVFVVEAEDITGSLEIEADRKVVARKVRLLREATPAELEALCVFFVGYHEIKTGIGIASGSATVTASGSATVTAYDSATVTASGSASVTASGSASVRASGSATVRASGSATVRASDSASVTASGSATVMATDLVVVAIYPYSWNRDIKVDLAKRATLVDQRGDHTVVRTAPEMAAEKAVGT